MAYANDGLRFLLELGAVGALAYWGFEEFGGVAHWMIGLGAPLAAAVVWGTFMSPKASRPTVDPVRLLIEIAVFGAGVAALLAAGASTVAIALALLAGAHLGLTFVLGQRPERGAATARPS